MARTLPCLSLGSPVEPPGKRTDAAGQPTTCTGKCLRRCEKHGTCTSGVRRPGVAYCPTCRDYEPDDSAAPPEQPPAVQAGDRIIPCRRCRKPKCQLCYLYDVSPDYRRLWGATLKGFCCDAPRGRPLPLHAHITGTGDFEDLDVTTTLTFTEPEWVFDDFPSRLGCANPNTGEYRIRITDPACGGVQGTGIVESCDPFFLVVVIEPQRGCEGIIDGTLIYEVYEVPS